MATKEKEKQEATEEPRQQEKTKEEVRDELAVQERAPLTIGQVKGGIVPKNFDEMWRFAILLHRSNLVPKGLNTVEKVVVALQMGMEVGLTPMAAIQNIAVINGRPSMWGDAALALVFASDLLDDFEEIPLFKPGSTPMRNGLILEGYEGPALDDGLCGFDVVALRAGKRSPVANRFTMADADRAGLRKKEGPWQEYPQRMLKMRARSWTLRDTCPDVLRGLWIREESMDLPMMVEGVVDTPKSDMESLRARLDDAAARTQERASEAASAVEDEPAVEEPPVSEPEPEEEEAPKEKKKRRSSKKDPDAEFQKIIVGLIERALPALEPFQPEPKQFFDSFVETVLEETFKQEEPDVMALDETRRKSFLLNLEMQVERWEEDAEENTPDADEEEPQDDDGPGLFPEEK